MNVRNFFLLYPKYWKYPLKKTTIVIVVTRWLCGCIHGPPRALPVSARVLPHQRQVHSCWWPGRDKNHWESVYRGKYRVYPAVFHPRNYVDDFFEPHWGEYSYKGWVLRKSTLLNSWSQCDTSNILLYSKGFRYMYILLKFEKGSNGEW